MMDEIMAAVESAIQEEVNAMKPMINLGSGKIHLPGSQPDHHGLVDANIYEYEYWHNVDKSPDVGADEVVDLFRYPWPWDTDSFSGALLSHIVEHIPHDARFWPSQRADALTMLPDGFYAFFAELWRVLVPDAIVHILWPSPWATGFLSDPTHTRPILPQTFAYLSPDPDAPFSKDFGSYFEFTDPPTANYQGGYAYNGITMTLPIEYYVKLRAVKP